MNPLRAPGAIRALGLASLLAIFAACAGPGPTPAPTEPPPTPSPVQASPNPNLVAFETHIRESTTQEGGLIRDLAAAQTGSQDQQRVAARQLVAWAANEQTWLDANIADTVLRARLAELVARRLGHLEGRDRPAGPRRGRLPADRRAGPGGGRQAGERRPGAEDRGGPCPAGPPGLSGPGGTAPGYRAGVSQTGYSRTFSGVPSFAEPSHTRSVPHWAFGTVYATVTSNVPLSQKQAAIAC